MAGHLSDELRSNLGNAIGDGMNEVVIFASFEDWRFQQGLFKPVKQKDASYPRGIGADSLKILPVGFNEIKGLAEAVRLCELNGSYSWDALKSET
jgi:hypothetical protein